jgi:aspartyl-tRNA(Asn)/glutamyl-tRNA(Gln) amidotransferase subunit B
MKEYKLNQKLAKQVMDSEYSELFETVIKESGVSPTMVAVFLTETLKALKREGVETDKVSDGQIREVFTTIATGVLTKEVLGDIFVWLSKHEGENVHEAISALGLKAVSDEELNALVDKAIEDNKKLVQERGEDSFGALMGIIMKASRGKIDAARLSKVLRERLKEATK